MTFPLPVSQQSGVSHMPSMLNLQGLNQPMVHSTGAAAQIQSQWRQPIPGTTQTHTLTQAEARPPKLFCNHILFTKNTLFIQSGFLISPPPSAPDIWCCRIFPPLVGEQQTLSMLASESSLITDEKKRRPRVVRSG